MTAVLTLLVNTDSQGKRNIFTPSGIVGAIVLIVNHPIDDFVDAIFQNFSYVINQILD